MDQRELISSGVSDIASSLGLGEAKEPPIETEPETPETPEVTQTPQAPEGETVEGDAPPETPEVVAKAPPKSWAKEQHEKWAQIPPEAQDYIELREKQMLDGIEQYKEYHAVGKTISDVIAPYRPMLAASGTDPAKAVAVLLNAELPAHDRPGRSPQAGVHRTRRLAWPHPAAECRAGAACGARDARALGQARRLADPREQQQFEETRTRVASEVESFSKTAPYFEEVAEDIVAFINSGSDLKTAYDKAVWANPVTRAKGERPAGEGNSRQTPGKSEG